MNVREFDILLSLGQKPYMTQRELAAECGCSLGTVNRSLRVLITQGYLNSDMVLSKKAMDLFQQNKPKNAIILAAGIGMRMVPINTETSKGLLEVQGEPLIERMIQQLHEVGVNKIYVIVGFMKEQYEYLIDKYDVELMVNSEYAHKNNIHSLKKAAQHLSNTYIIPCDLWCRNNPFSKHELYSWYMVNNRKDRNSTICINRKRQLLPVGEAERGNQMVGICYLTESRALVLKERIFELCKDGKYDDAFWEEALFADKNMTIIAKMVDTQDVIEINTYEQLRELDHYSAQLQTKVIFTVASAMGVHAEDIVDIEVLKKGMTNRSFLFSCKGNKYIMRIPGEGTDQLINRKYEAAVYAKIGGENLCDDIFYIDPNNGYKITKYFDSARVCDPFDEADLRKCMHKLRSFHNLGLEVEHTFNIFQQIEFYESLWGNEKSIYRDYHHTKKNVLSLKTYIDQYKLPNVLTHIDAVPDNFLFIRNEDGEDEIRLIDWEYAGMQDPHVDIAMFCIYSLYGREQVDRLIDIYFDNACTQETRVKIYCYIACCGLLWSNWCEYKRQLGVEFGEYSLRQYRYAKDYYRIVQIEWKRMEGSHNA